jgi:serine acetyltransferase
LVLFRLAATPNLPSLVSKAVRVLYRLVVGWIFGIELPPDTVVGPGLRLNHGTGVVINGNASLGARCDIKHGVTIGIRESGGRSPRLGDGVVVGSGAQILGDVAIGEDAVIGAGAIVLVDVPARHVAVGNPARVLPPRG